MKRSAKRGLMMATNRITACSAREVLDSRARPTLEVTLTAGALSALATVPSGKSTGSHEARELRDPDGIHVASALERIEHLIAPALVGGEADRASIDARLIELDGTSDKSRLGANAMIGVSLAAERLAALANGLPLWKHIAQACGTTPALPNLYMNMLNGGTHANFRLPFQEYLVVLGADSPRQAHETGVALFSHLGESVKAIAGEVEIGDEGGYSPEIADIRKPFEILDEVIMGEAGASLALDAAATEFFKDGSYALAGQSFDAAGLSALYTELINAFPITSIEDPFAEDAVDDFAAFTAREGARLAVVGDDLTVTSPVRIRAMIEKQAVNALIVKPNQVGTLTETYEAIRLAREAGWQIIVSHRSGETMDTFVSDLAVGVGADGLKAGAPNPRERKAKYERLIEIAEQEMPVY